MSLYFSICAPSGKFLCADALLDSYIHALKEASEKAAGTFTLSFSQDQCIWSVMMEAKDGKTTVINPHLYEKAKKFSMMIEDGIKKRTSVFLMPPLLPFYSLYQPST